MCMLHVSILFVVITDKFVQKSSKDNLTKMKFVTDVDWQKQQI